MIFSPGLLTDLRRIVLKKLRHHLLQVLVILIRIFLEVDGLDGVAAPDQLLSSDVIQVHQQYPDGNGRGLALPVTAAPWVPSPTGARAARLPKVHAFFEVEHELVTDIKVSVVIDLSE